MNPIFDEQYRKLVESNHGTNFRFLGDGTILVHVPMVTLPTGWNQTQTSIWYHIPIGYPVAKPDCFWTDLNLRLANGEMLPMNTSIQNPMPDGTTQLWFSWHSALWNPNADNLTTYLHMIEARLRELR